MSYLKMALRALESAIEIEDREGISPLVSVHKIIETPQTSKPDRILLCSECSCFRPATNSPNPAQAFGRCLKRNRGRYGCATACETVLTQELKTR